jgi:hypothetical protein
MESIFSPLFIQTVAIVAALVTASGDSGGRTEMLPASLLINWAKQKLTITERRGGRPCNTDDDPSAHQIAT